MCYAEQALHRKDTDTDRYRDDEGAMGKSTLVDLPGEIPDSVDVVAVKDLYYPLISAIFSVSTYQAYFEILSI